MPLIPSRKTGPRAAKSRTKSGITTILADSSAWIEYDRATGSAVHKRLRKLIDSNGPLAVTEPVVMEVCAGVRNRSHETELRRLLGSFGLLRFDPVSDFDAAARIYRLCRGEGITPRGLLDCMIAAVALRNDAALLACDRDLAAIAGVVNIPLDRASLSGRRGQ